MERGTSVKSEMLQHLNEINTHLAALASPAPDLTPEQEKRLQKQLKELSAVHQGVRNRQQAIKLKPQRNQGYLVL